MTDGNETSKATSHAMSPIWQWGLAGLTVLVLFWGTQAIQDRFAVPVPKKGTTVDSTIRAPADAVFDLHKTYLEEAQVARKAYVPIYNKDHKVFYDAREEIIMNALKEPAGYWRWPEARVTPAPVVDAALPEKDLEVQVSTPASKRKKARTSVERSVVKDATIEESGITDAEMSLLSSSEHADAQHEIEEARRKELESLFRGLFRIIEPLFQAGVIADSEFPNEKSRIRVYALSRYVFVDTKTVLRFSEVRSRLAHGAEQFFFKVDLTIRNQVMQYLLDRLPVNMVYAQENESYIRDISEVTGIKMVLIRRGEILARPGEVIDSRAHHAIRASYAAAETVSRWRVEIGRFVLLCVAVFLFAIAVKVLCRREMITPVSSAVIYLGVITIVLISHVAIHLWPIHPLVMPQAAIPLMMAVTLSRPIAMASAMFSAVVFAMTLSFDLGSLVAAVAGGLVASVLVKKRRVNSVLAVGILVGLAQGQLLEATSASLGRLQNFPSMMDAAQAFLGGLLSGGLAWIASPFIQRLLGQTPLGRLNMLGDFESPALRELRERLPDLFAHTVRVFSLADHVSRELNVDRPLLRVGALYHDLGKLVAIDPLGHVSATTLSTISARYDLSREVMAFMEQHHGTLPIDLSDPQSPRHVGPKPECREVAIVMIANVVEHRMRGISTVGEPDAATIAEAISDEIQRMSNSYQFDRCDLTQRELQTIEAALIAFYRHRSDDKT